MRFGPRVDTGSLETHTLIVTQSSYDFVRVFPWQIGQRIHREQFVWSRIVATLPIVGRTLRQAPDFGLLLC